MAKKRRSEPEIPTASMADIAFLLIIFFLVTTSFNQDMGISLTLPPVTEGQELQVRKKNILNIWVNWSGEILLGEQGIVSLQQVEPEVRRMIAENPNLIVSLKSDRRTDYDTFVQVLDKLKKAEARKISLAEPD